VGEWHVDKGVSCLNVRSRVFFCPTWFANHSVVWVAVGEVGTHIAQTDRHSRRASKSVNRQISLYVIKSLSVSS
jgi:hypothetical protein